MSVAIPFDPTMKSLGPAVAAIGVFDGVHLGHQALLDAAVRDARRRDVRSVAVTFDRDPDTIIDPDTAAPQLLTLEDKVRFIGDTGIEIVLVVPFTPEVARLEPNEFLSDVLSHAIDPQAIHVGYDFRFGARASGDVAALEEWAEPRDAAVVPHRLLQIGGDPVTSTRIRDLIAVGEVGAARELLGRPARVTGEVVHGRGAGKGLGAPTANLVPVPFAALPEDGVYAGLADVAQGVFAAAISVGTPPMFPEAREHLEAHLIDFDGDLYGRPMALQFLKRLRGLKRYASLDELTAAIRKDVRETADVVAHEEAELLPLEEGLLPDGTPVVEDPEALLAAETAVRGDEPESHAWAADSDRPWTPVITWHRGLLSERLVGESDLMRAWGVLAEEGIPTGWDPYPPGRAPDLYVVGWVAPKPISLLVPEEYADEACELLRSQGIEPSV